MMVNWLTVLLSALGGTAGAVLVLAALWKFLGTVWADKLRLQLELKNNQHLDKFRTELKTQADITQQLLDAGLQKAILVSRTQFETEFNAYKEIYSALTEVRYSVEQTRPIWNTPSSENEDDRNKRRRAELQKAYENLTTAHNKLVLLRDNLAPFYAADIYPAVEACVNTSKMELFQLLTGGQQTFSESWSVEGYRRQEEFKAAYRKVGELIRERITSLGIFPH